MSRMFRIAAVLGIAVLGFGTATAAQAAGDDGLQAQVDQQLAEHPGGVQTEPGVIEYDGGAVRVVIEEPDSAGGGALSRSTAAASTVHGCATSLTAKWVCFYDDRDFGGRMLQFRDAGLQSLADYGFSNKVSSWVNTTGRTVSVYDTAGGTTRIWTEGANSFSSYVGNSLNDRASSFRS
jgi:hypothetical protein